MEKPIKIILSIILFLCLADMPYSFYQLVRLLALGGFALLAFMANKDGQSNRNDNLHCVGSFISAIA
jgi:hypothetical protein